MATNSSAWVQALNRKTDIVAPMDDFRPERWAQEKIPRMSTPIIYFWVKSGVD
jgi:hypothetical protein